MGDFQTHFQAVVHLFGICAQFIGRHHVQWSLGGLCNRLCSQSLSSTGIAAQETDKASALVLYNIVKRAAVGTMRAHEGVNDITLVRINNELVESSLVPDSSNGIRNRESPPLLCEVAEPKNVN